MKRIVTLLVSLAYLYATVIFGAGVFMSGGDGSLKSNWVFLILFPILILIGALLLWFNICLKKSSSEKKAAVMIAALASLLGLLASSVLFILGLAA